MNSFSEINSDPDVVNALATAYNNINDVDLWVGLLAEQHQEGTSVGPTLHELLRVQFENLRDSDAYFYEVDPWFFSDEIDEIRNTYLSAILERNTGLTNLPLNVFYKSDCSSGTPSCDNISMYSSGNDLIVSGLTAPLNSLQVFDQNWNTAFNCSGNCLETEYIADLPNGQYYVKAVLRNANWTEICTEANYLTIQGSVGLVLQQDSEQLFFNAQRKDGEAVLYWTTNTEFLTDRFVIERSSDMANFEAMKEVESLHDSPNAYFEYTDRDIQPLQGVNYYRIKKVYKNGEFRYSNIKELYFDFDQNALMSIYPNPASSFVYVSLNRVNGQKGELKLFNSFGQLVKTHQLSTISQGATKMNISELPPGVYALTFKGNKQRLISEKLIITKL